MKIKKNFEKIYFSDNFFSWAVHCAPLLSEILTKILKFQNIYMRGILQKLEVALGMFFLLSKPENGGTCFTLVHCAQTKNILANEPSPYRCSMVQVLTNLEILSLDDFLWHTKIAC